MIGIKEFFETDFPGVLSLDHTWEAQNEESTAVFELRQRHFLDFQAGVRYTSFLLPPDIEAGIVIGSILLSLKTFLRPVQDKVVLPAGHRLGVGTELYFEHLGENGLRIIASQEAQPSIDAMDLPFSGRVIIYADKVLPEDLMRSWHKHAKDMGVGLIFRDGRYVKLQTDAMEPLAFISHDSRDKDEVVRPLARQLKSMAVPVWYDEYSLSVGDSLREKIEEGLKQCKYCIIVLTPNFLKKGGWAKREYQSVFTREIVEDRNVVLPIWSGVTVEDVYEYSPILADRVGLDWSKGVEEVGTKLYRKLMADE